MLTENTIRAARPRQKTYRLADGKGLALQVEPTGGRLWRFRFRLRGKALMLSLGRWPDTTLKVAREARDECRRQVAAGINPSDLRKADKRSQADTFRAVAAEFMALQKKRLTSSTWQRDTDMLERMLYPCIGDKPISDIEAPDLLAALKKVEQSGRVESSHRARGLAGRVFRFAIATGRAKRDPSQDLRGALEKHTVRSYPALTDPVTVGGLMRAIWGATDTSPVVLAALKLSALLALRPGELRKLEWSWVTLDGPEPVLRLPPEVMKARREHLVPAPRQAVAILTELRALTGRGRHVLPAMGKRDTPMSENTVSAALLRLGFSRDQHSAHGFRSTFSSLMHEQGWDSAVIELQLAHKDRDVVRQVYNRSARLAERRKMMQAWADYLDVLRASTGNVVPIRRPA